MFATDQHRSKDTSKTCQKEVLHFEKNFDPPMEPQYFSGSVILRKAYESEIHGDM